MMALFGRNKNEAAYVNGKKHITDVIKNTGSGKLLIWRQPEEDFNTNSTLIVMPGESAIFIKSGAIEQVFDNGTYQLSTENYPFISRLRNALSGGVSTFNCVVYFVRQADSEEILWGTQSPIQVRDKVWGIRTSARVRGAYKVRMSNPAKFLEKLLGNNVTYQTQDELTKYFSNEFQGKIKTVISKFLNGLDQELIGLDAYLDDLSTQVEPEIDAVFADYGLKCVKFSLAGLDIDTTKYDAIDESQVGAISKAKLAQGDKAVMDVLGQDWGKQQAANILTNISNNPGAGGFAAMGAGIGMGAATGGAMSDMSNQMLSPLNGNDQSSKTTPTEDSSKNTDNTAGDPMEVLGKLKQLLTANLITQEQYDAKVAEVLKRM